MSPALSLESVCTHAPLRAGDAESLHHCHCPRALCVSGPDTLVWLPGARQGRATNKRTVSRTPGNAIQQQSEDTGNPGFKYLFWVLKLNIQKNYIANASVEIKMRREKISTKLSCSKDTFFIG